MVVFVGQFEGYQDISAQCEFRLDCAGEAPKTMKDFFETNWAKIRDLASAYGSENVPGSLTWTRNQITDDNMNTSVYRFGKGLKVRFQHKELGGLPMDKWPATFVTDLHNGLSVAFPAVQRLPDAVLMQMFVNLTAPWDGKSFGTPWQMYLSQQPWRKSEIGEIYLQASSEFPAGIDPHAFNPRIPYNSAKSPDSSEIMSDSDVSRTLKFARDNGWPLLLSCASSFDGSNSITVTYETTLMDCEDKIPWYWSKFVSLMIEDNLVGLPAAARSSIFWTRSCYIEDHKIHIYLKEAGASTPEDDGPPCYLLYTPRASLQLRCESGEAASRIVTMCYGQEPELVEKHHGKEWALVASIFSGTIDPKHLVQLERPMDLEVATAWNKEIFIDGLASTPYRVGTGKFAAQFKPGKPYSATMAIEKGVHNDHGTAIFFEQANRRCLITRRIYNLSDEDTFWEVMKDWAQFQPKLAKPRVDPGLLYYPAEFSHMDEQYWDYLDDPTKHPDADPSAQYFPAMSLYAEAVSSMDFSGFIPQPDAEAPEKSQRVASLAALSRRCPIQDATDYWSSIQDQAQEESGTVEHGFAPAQDVHNVDTCAGDSRECCYQTFQ
jgi:hypothetical protein